MGWLFVFLAASSEMIGVVGLERYSKEKTLKNGMLLLAGFGISFALLYASFHYLQVAVAYAVWTGIGTAGAVLISMFFFGESKNKSRIISVLLIIIGVTGLKAVS
ncbi:DMT family transporter [Metabacillus fastidiosus]|uniref:DMT family transporter n=1 Tax=Metabacillus fastidiosus TaxID=1458 RepID=UPI002E22C4A5|nr:multidrug efflux SMR transporter [Metabacillus fastidiosus]